VRRASLAVVAGLALAGCGDDDDGPPPDRLVRATLADFGRATAAKDYKALCSRILAPALVEQVTSIGLPCEVALRQGLGTVRQPRLTVGRVQVQGDRATAEVRSSAAGQEPSRDTVELQRVAGRWRISSLAGAQPAPPAP